ncbi:hypothetical protein UFOVP53_194 [uncultured Caudovirales phage]|uniref:Uncharacterized protein n=1 Tax=uncultured Caudovirales phage TaxID=2100421 RepID=A0A6J5KXK0_9CAUD|nr:hypothetical protein UFOVP53_194 [uncultured Caudovirales phage]
MSSVIVNSFDIFHDEIERLILIYQELKIEDNKFLSDSIHQLVLEDLIEYASENFEIADLVEYGFKGYSNMTHIELINEVRHNISGLCGEEQDFDISEFYSYPALKEEIQAETTRLIELSIGL